MSKYDLTSLKRKITPRDKEEIELKAAERFHKADETLGTELENPALALDHRKIVSRVVRKTFSIPEGELHLIEKIKDKALNKRIVLVESEVIRLGLLIASEITDHDLEIVATQLEKMQMGRPKKMSFPTE